MKLMLPLCLAAAALAAAGCHTSVNTVEPAQASSQRQMISDKRVVTDTGLNNKVRVVGLNTYTGPGGFLKLQIEVQNLTNKRQDYTYRIEWFDENAMLLNLPTTTATPDSLEGKESKSLVVLAPTARAKDFRIKFLEPVN
jgi:uncharacterized protein YcfL